VQLIYHKKLDTKPFSKKYSIERMMKLPNQLIETLEGKKQPTKKTFIRPYAQTYHKFNIVFKYMNSLVLCMMPYQKKITSLAKGNAK